MAQAQDAATVLSLFQSFLGAGQPAVLATPAAFDPYGLVAVLQQLRIAVADDALFALSLSTHQPAQLRLNQLDGYPVKVR